MLQSMLLLYFFFFRSRYVPALAPIRSFQFRQNCGVVLPVYVLDETGCLPVISYGVNSVRIRIYCAL